MKALACVRAFFVGFGIKILIVCDFLNCIQSTPHYLEHRKDTRHSVILRCTFE